MLRWMNDNMLRDIIRNECINKIVEVVPIENKLRLNQLRWFEHAQRRP